MTDRLIIVAHFVAIHDKIDAARDRLQAMIAPTRAEPGCIEYRLMQDRAAPQEFTFFEVFADRSAWDEHMETAYVKQLLADIPLFFTETPQIRLMTELG